ncbi:MAG: hypothetical protein NW241_15035 [Bacteroidia bacterium]|nr:hypothetical protein [Bacteroidia bacterium]
MIIANPLYDVVFKYLLEDAEIARGLLSAILGEEILSLEVKPQETSVETGGGIHILRFDFKAVIRTAGGGERKLLIELQKAKQAFDVMRFRRYLGDNYRREDLVSNQQGEQEMRPLPIVTIYFLGFSLGNLPSGVVHVNREYRDVITQQVLQVEEPFVELLTHDSYIIQVRKLEPQARTQLERILQIFSPEFQTQDRRQMDFPAGSTDPLVQKMAERLGRAIASDDIRDKMDVEDELDRIFDRETGKLAAVIAEKEVVIAEKEVVIAEKEEIIAEKEGVIAEKEEIIAEKEGVIAEKEGVIAEKEVVIAEKEGIIAEKEGVIAEKEGVIAEKEGLIAEKEQQLAEEKRLAEAERQKNLELQQQLEELRKRFGL